MKIILASKEKGRIVTECDDTTTDDIVVIHLVDKDGIVKTFMPILEEE